MTSLKEKAKQFHNNNPNFESLKSTELNNQSDNRICDNLLSHPIHQQSETCQSNNLSNINISYQHHQMQNKQQAINVNVADDYLKRIVPPTGDNKDEILFNAKMRNQFVDQIKRELSLPHDIKIPEHFISKQLSLLNIHGFNRTNNKKQHDYSAEPKLPDRILYHSEPSTDDDDRKQLKNGDDKHKAKTTSRVIRRQSLYEIGFGQMSTYQKIKVIGSGSYSSVYKATSSLTNELVALKEIKLQRDEGVPFFAIREVSLLKELKHANIITLHDFIYTKRYLTLVFEYMEYELGNYMGRCKYDIDINNVKLFLFQLLRGLKYCHDRLILHRDLKPQNILLNEIGELKLADFGLARAKSVPIKTFTDEVVTLWYRPPDVLLGNTDYGPSIDIWGVGCVFYEMATSKNLFTANNTNLQLYRIFETIGYPDNIDPSNFDHGFNEFEIKMSKDFAKDSRLGFDIDKLKSRVGDDGIDLLKKFLKCDPKHRISSSDAISHQYFGTLPDAIYRLSHSQSIYAIDTIKYVPDKLHNLFSYMQ